MENYLSSLFIVLTATSHLGLVESIPSLSDGRCTDLYDPARTAKKHLIIKRGDPLLLNCSLLQKDSSTLKKSVLWIKNGQPFISKNILGRKFVYENGSLHIPVTKSFGNGDEMSDDGTYYCLMNFSSQSVLSSPIKVTVGVLSRISHQQELDSLKVGSFHQINCNMDKASPRPIITWFRNDVPVANGSIYSVYEQSSRLSLTPNRGFTAQHSNLSVAILPSGALEIGPVSIKEAGLYYCTATNAVRTRKSSSIQMTVSGNTSETVNQTVKIQVKPANKTAPVGSTTHLECFATGQPSPQISWRRNGDPIDFRSERRLFVVGQGTLFILQTTISDHGQYTCTASNGVDAPKSKSASLTVLVPPVIEDQPPCSNYASVGESSRLNCSVSGLPSPVITWYKEGKMLHPSENLKFVNGGMVINSVTKADAGIYQCFGFNSEGTVSAAQRLYIADRIEDDSDSFGRKLISEHFAQRQTTLRIKLLQLSHSSASISWTGLRRVTNYEVTITDTQTQEARTEQSSQPSLLITDLEVGHEMLVGVRPLKVTGDSSPPRTISFVVPAARTPPGAVENFFLMSPASTEILASWSKPELDPPAQSYRVHVHNMVTPKSYLEKNFTQTSNIITGLRKYTTYGVKVAVVNAYGEVGPFSALTTIKTLSDAPEEPPLNVSVSTEGIDSVLVKWSPPPPNTINGVIKSYKLRYKQRSQVATKSAPGDVTQVYLKGLKKNAAYTLKIQVVNSYGPGPFSKKVSFSTPKRWRAESKAPGKPKTLAIQRYATSISVSWSKPEGNTYVREYVIGWGKTVPNENTVVIESNKKFYEISGLEPSTRYFLSVQAGNHAGRGEKALGKARTKTTEEEIEELYPPLGVHAVVLTSTTLNVSWHDTMRKKDSRYYVVRYKTNVPMEPRVQQMNSSDLNCIIHGLRPHTHYDIAVRVVQGNRKSAWSMTEKTVTKESIPGSAPMDLTVMPIEDDSTSVQLNWQPPEEPNGELTGYLIFYTTDPNNQLGKWVIETVIGDQLSKEINDLTRNTHYYFKALARNSVGTGPYSKIVEYITGSTQKEEGINTWSMPTWTWYTIIGGVTFLVLCIVAVATLIICRNRNVARPSQPTEKNGMSSRGRLYPSHSMPDNSWHNSRSLHADEQSEYADGRSSKSPFLASQDYQSGYLTTQELVPLNRPILSQEPSGVFSYSPYHPNSNSILGTGNYHNVMQSRFSDLARTPDEHIMQQTTFPRSTHTSDSRYSPDPSVNGSRERNVDSAYGSEPQYSREESPRATIQHSKSYAKGQPKYLHKDSLLPGECSEATDTSGNSADSRSESASFDEMHADLANAVDFVECMKAQQATLLK
uniref:Neogenin-like n=1 Tax=Phallusia mammillata TaxID=59560 RepID=A0A6F9DLH8_9ASCI|nr:neogenin-like [Phallusia mammillata]